MEMETRKYCKSSAIYALTNAGVFVSAQIVALLIVSLKVHLTFDLYELATIAKGSKFRQVIK